MRGVGAYVYWCYDAEDELLYIGSTIQPVETRIRQHVTREHRRRRPAMRWTHLIARVEVDEHPDEASARRAEREALYRNPTKFNIRHGDVLWTLTTSKSGRAILRDNGLVDEVVKRYGIDRRKLAS